MDFSVDVFDEILQKELAVWEENESEGYMVLKGRDFDVEHYLNNSKDYQKKASTKN